MWRDRFSSFLYLCFRIFFRRFFTTELIGVPPLDQGAGTELFARPSKGTLLAHPYIPLGGDVMYIIKAPGVSM